MISPTIQQMRLFEAVARHGSVTRAAQEVHLTQPSVSMQIKRLEEKVGVPLTEQIGKKIHLTAAGEIVRLACGDVLSRIAGLEDDLAALRGGVAGPLRIAVVSSAKYFLPQLLGSFTRRFPDVEPVLQITNRARLLQRLAANEDDLYVMGQAPGDLPVVDRPFLENVIVPIAHPNNPLAGKRRISLERLAQEPFIKRESGSGTRKAVEDLFASHGLEVRTQMYMDDSEAIKQGVASGLGIATASIHSLRQELARGDLAVLDVEGFPLRRSWYAVHHTGKRLSVAAQTFLDYLLEEGEREVAHLTTRSAHVADD